MHCPNSSGEAGGASPRLLGTASPQNIKASSASELGVPHKNLEFTKKPCPSPVPGALASGFPVVPAFMCVFTNSPGAQACGPSGSDATRPALSLEGRRLSVCTPYARGDTAYRDRQQADRARGRGVCA